MQLRFTIFSKLFHSVQFLTIRQGQLRIRFCGKSNQNRTLKGILPCTAQPFRFRLQEELQPDLLLTFSLNSTRAALTRAAHSDRRPLDVVSLADFRTGGVPGSEKPMPANPKGDRRSVLSEKEIQDSDNCSCLHMGCICCYYQINNCTVPQGRKGALAPLH